MIKSIGIMVQGAGQVYMVGYNNVAEIKNRSVEWENHIDWIYEIIDKDGNILIELINCPLEIKYS